MDKEMLVTANKLQEGIEVINRRLKDYDELYNNGPYMHHMMSATGIPRGEKRILVYKSDIEEDDFLELYCTIREKIEKKRAELQVKLNDL